MLDISEGNLAAVVSLLFSPPLIRAFLQSMEFHLTRTALRDITRNHTIMDDAQFTPHTNTARTPAGLLTPSPDEEIIKQRGKKTVTPNLEGNLLGWLLTPTSKPRTPTKSHRVPSLPTRCSPRKRLQMVDGSTSPGSSPSKQIKLTRVQSQLVKRQRIQRKFQSPADVMTAIKGLTQNQLVDIITQVVNKHPELEEEIASDLPLPDLRPMDDKLNLLSHNIFKSFPHTRWGSNRDAFCYRRVSTHLTAFKKECIEQGKLLLNSHQLASVIDYVLLAWSYVSTLPDWDNATHNKVKLQCFSALASQCMNALKKSNFEREHYEDIVARLNEAKSSCEEIDPCVQKVEQMLKKLKC